MTALLMVECIDSDGYVNSVRCAVPINIDDIDQLDHVSLLKAISAAKKTAEISFQKKLVRNKKHLRAVK